MKKLLMGMAAGIALAATSPAVAGGIEVIYDKAGFPEGPVWVAGKLYYAEYGKGLVQAYDGKAVTKVWEKKDCGPSAVVPAGDGQFLVTCYDNGTIARISTSGATVATYDKDDAGQPFVGPNDFAADASGGVYFTASGPWESEPIVGKIFYIAAKGGITQVADDLHYANGLALSNDGKTLYCAESEAHRVIQFKVGADGTLSERRLYVRGGDVDAKSGASAFPDGLKMDSKGNLYIGQFSAGRIVVVGPDRKFVRAIDVPSPAAPNLNFAADEGTVYIMAVDDVNNAPYLGKVYKAPNK